MPQDSLTLEFKKQLKAMRKTSGITDVTPMPPTQLSQPQRRGGRTLADIAGFGDYSQQPDESGNLLTAIAKGVWQFGETAAFGAPRLLYSEEFKKMLEPKGFAERVGAGIGGAAGFLLPMKWAGSGINLAVKGFAKGGVKKFSKSFVDDSIKIMEKDKSFMDFVNKKVTRGEIKEGGIREFMEGMLQEPRNKLLTLGTKEGEAIAARTVKDRMNFAKNFTEQTPKILAEKLTEAGFGAKGVTNIVNTLGTDIAKRIGIVGASSFKFPMTRLHQVIAGWTGNGKIGNLAAHALEEAALFAAVETPMNFIHSLAEEEVDFNLGSTLGHAFILGSALGLIRMVPGGKDDPLVRTAFSRITNTFKNRRRYRNYELEADKARGIGNEIALADRAKFTLEVKNVFQAEPHIFKNARKLIKADPKRNIVNDYRIPIKTMGDIDTLMASATGRKQLKRIMGDVEKAFFDDWYPKFLRAIPGDLTGSMPRMLLGAMAFNFETYKDWMDGGDMPLEDIVFHTALGMFLSKRGKKLEYTDSLTGKLETLHKDRPLIYGDSFERADKYLRMLGSNLDSGLFAALYNEKIALSKGFESVDSNTSDMQKLKKIAVANGIIVEKYGSETTEDGTPIEREKIPAKYKSKDTDGKEVEKEQTLDFNDELYTTFSEIVRRNFVPKMTESDFDVLEGYEVGPRVLEKIKKQLSKEKFDALLEYSNANKRGVSSSEDLFDITLGSGESTALAYRDLVQRFIVDMHNTINRKAYGAAWNASEEAKFIDIDFSKENTKLVLKPIKTSSALDTPSHEHSLAMVGEDANISKLLKPWIEYKGDAIEFTQEMSNEIFGEWSKGERVEGKESLLDKYESELHDIIFKDDINATPRERRLLIGDPLIQNWTTSVLNRRTVRDHWRQIQSLSPNASNLGKFDSAEYTKAKKLITEIFDEGGYLAARVNIKRGDDILDPNSSKNESDYSFWNSFRQILSHDISRKREQNYGGVETVKDVQISKVKDLKLILENKLPILTMNQSFSKSELIQEISDYATNQSLLGLRKANGKTLNYTDRAKIKLYQEAGILTPSMEMHNIKGELIDSFDLLFERFKEVSPDVAKNLDNTAAFLRHLSTKENAMNNLVSEVNDFKLFTELSDAAKQLNVSPSEFSERLFDGFNKHLSQYIRGTDGNGFITVGQKSAKVSAEFLSKLVMKLDLLDYDISRVTHEQLLKDINNTIGKTFTNDARVNNRVGSILKQVMDISMLNPSRASVAQQILAKSGLYKPTERLWTWDELSKKRPETIDGILRDVEAELNYQFLQNNSFRDLELIHESDRFQNESKYPVEKPITANIDQFIKKYKVTSLKPGASGQSVGKILKGQTDLLTKGAYNFYDVMKKGASLTHKGKKYTAESWVQNRALDDAHYSFLLDSVNVYNQLRNSKTRRVITATKGERNPRFEEYTFQDNNIFKELHNTIGELTFINLDSFKVQEGGRVLPYDIRRESTSSKFKSEFYDIIGKQVPILRKGGLGGQEAIVEALSPELKSGYIVARIGTLGKGIGIPIGDITSDSNRVTNPMNRIVQSFISDVYKQRKSELPQELVDKIDSFIERKLIDRNKKEITDAINLDSDGWQYNRIGERLDRVGEDFTMMLTNIIGNKVMGNEYWKVVKGDNWSDSEALAKKPLKYMKLLFNGSARNIDRKIAGELASILKRPELDFIPESIRGKDSPILKNLERFAKDPKKGGGTKWHYIRDEAILEGGDMPGVSSLFKKLKAQIDAENTAANIDLGDMKTDDFFPGGIPDSSMFDSIQIVSKDFMDTIKFIKSINEPGIETIKPIGALASSTDAVWLDKTVWITDAAWEPYLKRHGIDGVKMGSSVKMAGEGLIGKTNEVSGRSEKAIYLDDYDTIEQVLNEKSDLSSKIITLPIETYSISSVMKADKSATMPLQLTAELTTPLLNQSYFNWVMEDRLRDYLNDADISYGSGDINDIAAKLRFEDMEASTEQLGLMQKWIGKGLDPTFMPWKRQVRNSLKRQFLDNRGVFTPKNIYGTQSNMVPTFASYGTKEFLRLSTFRNEGTAEVPNRKQWTYGEIETDVLNRGKKVEVDRIHFIEHNEAAKDNILGKTEIGSKSIEKLLDGKKIVTLGELHDALIEYNKTLTGKTYQVAIVAHRTPTTRVSDKVVVALKGFGDLTGNSVRINHSDAWIRLEADHDMDKLNYWWDTPKDILNHWDSLGGKVDSINGIQIRKTIEGLNIADGKSLVRYSDSDRDSQFYRGVVVKSRRVIQFLKSYRNAKYPNIEGFSAKLGDRGRVRIADSDIVDRVENQIAEDIQRIVDAQGAGYDNTIFNANWFNRTLFGVKGDDKYPGLIKKEVWNQGGGPDKKGAYEVTEETLSPLEQDIVNAVIRPYKRLLQLQTSVYENGESKKVDYDSLVDYVQIYKNQINNLTKSVYFNLLSGNTDSKNKYNKEDIDVIFKKNKEFINPFNLDSAKFAEAKEGIDVLTQNENMVATDRMMAVIGGNDLLRMPRIEYKNQTETDNVLMEYLTGDTKDVSNATKALLEGFKTDAQKIQSLNSIDYRIRRYKNSAGSFRRQRDGDMSSYWSRRADQLVELRDKVNSEIMSDPRTQSFVRQRVRKQIKTQLLEGKKWQDYKGKSHDLSSVKPYERNSIVNSKWMRNLIERSVWDVNSQKLLVEIRGINSDDYLQTLAIYNVMSNISGSGLNPSTVGREMSQQWETDRLKFRINYSKQWSDFRDGKSDISKDANDIMNDALNELDGKYHEWNEVSPGLGQQFIFSVMTPEMSPYVVTYHKGHLMPGFKQTYTQGKFVSLGLRFFNRIDSLVADQVIDVIGRPISNEIAFLRGKNSDIVLSESALTSANIRKRTPVDFETEGGSPLIDYTNTDQGKLKVDQIHDYLINDNKPLDNEQLNFQKLNDHVLKTIGLTGDIALDYINYKAPSLGMELLGDLRLVTDMDFIPSNALTRSGHVVPVRNYNDLLRHKKNQVAMLFGDSSNKNIFTGKRNIVAPESLGTPDNSFASKEYLKKTANRFLNENGC